MGKKGYLTDFECGMVVVGVRWAGLRFTENAQKRENIQ